MKELKEESAGSPVALHVGERMSVMLHEVAGTGYRWHIGTECAAVLHLDRDDMAGGDTKPGASSSRTWIYTARHTGTCELRFDSMRSWEKTVTGKTIAFPVTVHKAD